MISNVEHILAHHDPHHACNQGSIIRLQNGELLLGYNQERGRVHTDSGQSCFIRSRDNGKSWDPETNRVVWPFDEYQGNWDCAFSQSKDGTIMMHTRVCSFVQASALNGAADQVVGGPPPGRRERLKRQTGYALMKSKDNGESWHGPIPVNTAPMADSGLSHYIVGGSGAGHIIELPDGGLLMPLHGSETREFIAQSGENIRIFVLRSDDGGENWEYWATVAHDASNILQFAEPGMTRLGSGRLVCLIRAMARPGRFDNMWCVYSDDDGASWSRPVRTELWGYPPDVMELQDGRVLAVYGHRRDPFGVHGCVSDDGINWFLGNAFTIREGGRADPSFKQYWHTGYPSVTQCDDGTIVTAYHEYTDEAEPVQCMWVTRFTL
jgi:sialidase-1